MIYVAKFPPHQSFIVEAPNKVAAVNTIMENISIIRSEFMSSHNWRSMPWIDKTDIEVFPGNPTYGVARFTFKTVPIPPFNDVTNSNFSTTKTFRVGSPIRASDIGEAIIVAHDRTEAIELYFQNISSIRESFELTAGYPMEYVQSGDVEATEILPKVRKPKMKVFSVPINVTIFRSGTITVDAEDRSHAVGKVAWATYANDISKKMTVDSETVTVNADENLGICTLYNSTPAKIK